GGVQSRAAGHRATRFSLLASLFPLARFSLLASRFSSDVLVQLVQPDRHVARLAAVGWPEDPGVVELVDDPGGAAIANPQPPLQQRRAAALVLDAGLGRLAEERVAAVIPRGPAAALAIAGHGAH